MSNEIVVAESPLFLAPAARLDVVLEAYQAKKEFINHVLDEGKDYGTTPGTGDKPALLKPGAEKLLNFFGLMHTFDDVNTIEDWTGKEYGGEPFFFYRQRINLYRIINGERILVGTADGSCNSWEKKYRYRKQERICPACGMATVIKGKAEYGGGWLCWAKKGGCGAKYPDGDEVIESQEVGQVKNPDPAEQANTVLKMAQKRALVAGVLITTGASDYFTQDVDDFVEGTFTTNNGHSDTPPPEDKPKRKSAPKKPNGNGSSWNPVGILVEAGICENVNAASGLLNSHVSKDIISAKDKDALIAWGKRYRGWRDLGSEPEAAADNATQEIDPK